MQIPASAALAVPGLGPIAVHRCPFDLTIESNTITDTATVGAQYMYRRMQAGRQAPVIVAAE
jgi:hypothetical protein